MKKVLITAILFQAALLGSACSEYSDPPPIASQEVKGDYVPVTPEGSVSSGSAQKLTYKIGPFNLPAGQKAEVMWETPGTIDFKADEPLWVVSYEHNIEDSSGGELPANLLHIAVLTNASQKNELCTEKEVASPFIAATSITKKIELPEGSGYSILPTDQLGAKVILQNPTTQDYAGVYFAFSVRAVPMRNGKGYKDVTPLLLNTDPCDYYPLSVAPKEFMKKESSFVVIDGGLLTKAYGLLQDYGVEVSLSAKGQPTPFWEASAELSSDHKIISLPTFEDPAGIPLKAGDEISLSVVYDNSSEEWLSGATGAVMAYVTRTEDDSTGSEKSVSKGASVSVDTAQKLLLKP